MAHVVGESAMAFAYRALPGRVRFGWGASADHLVEELEAAGATRILLVHAEAERELAERLARPLGDAVVGTFTDVRQHVPVDVAHAGRRAAAASGADWILSVGGGSTTGAAKAIALEAGVQIAAVPTTYAGSEMTPVWGMTEDGVKQTGRDMRVLPSLVVYDPELTTSLPAAVTGPSAFNAMAHCVASYTAPGANPITALVADEGIRALSAGVVRATHDPFGREGRELLLYGAHLAGSAFAVAGSGLHHRICHVLGGRFDLPHAATHTVMLPQVLAFNEAATPAVATRIRFAVSAGLETFSAGAAQAVFELIESVGGPLSLAEIGMPRAQLRAVAESVVAGLRADNPRPVSLGDVVSILEAAYEGVKPPAYHEAHGRLRQGADRTGAAARAGDDRRDDTRGLTDDR